MDTWKQKAPFDRRELYYFDTTGAFDPARLAARLFLMIQEELKQRKKKGVLILCIGTDRSTGDSLGPLIGYHLRRKGLKRLQVVGTLNRPVHAMNLDETLMLLNRYYPDHLVVAVDASVGTGGRVGCVTLGKGAIRPGLGVMKELRPVGDLFITGIVSVCSSHDPLTLQSIRLGTVMQMAECISESICLVEKLWEKTAFV